MTGACPNCLMQVDGIPNVRSCTEPVRDGMRVERQNAWPSVDHDIHGWLNTFSFMMPPGFYYKIFHRPRWAWKTVEPFIRSKAGLGKAPKELDHEPREVHNLHADVLVIGAGPAGLAAAVEAASAGASTVVLEERAEVGVDGAGLATEAEAAGARIIAGTPAFGVFGGPLIAAANGERLYRIRARHLVFATGAVEQAAVFPNNDLPGVMLSSAVDLLVDRYRVLPGRRAVVLTSSEKGYETARALRDAGADVTIVDLRPDARPVDGFAVIAGSTIVAAEGRRRVREVVVGTPGDEGGRTIPCDLVVLAGFQAPSTNLLAMTGAELAFDETAQAFLPVELPPNVHAAGAVAGARSLEGAVAQGRLAGLEAGMALGLAPPDADERIERLRAEAAAEGDPVVLPPEVGAGHGKQFACLCMDVTNKELKTAVTEGFDSMELLKRYTTITMGPCQGKACMMASQRLCSRTTGSSFSQTRPTTARPPWTPVELGTLAGWRRNPRKETTIHDRHADVGATFMWAGDWRRPHHYTTPEDEVEAVRTRVGVIDVSTLGKFRVKGPEAVTLLERLYPSRFADLAIGRIRYGVMLNDEGVIVDDGTVARLGDDEFFVTVTTGNTAALERWITWWNADWGLDVRVLNLTGAYAAVNLAGPASRDVMRSLTDADVSGEAVPYLSATTMDVAGVPALVLRIGFVGELGYEIHVPVDVRRARLGRGHDGRRTARDPAVRPGGAADPPSGEAAHPGRAGHRRRVRSVRGGSRVDGQGGQGRLPRQARARGSRRRGAGRAARRLHLSRGLGAARGRERGPRRRMGGSRHLGPQERRGRGHRRSGLGARGLGERRDAVRDPVRPTPRERHRRDAAVLRPRRREAPVVNEPIRRSPLARTHADLGAVADREAGWELVAHYGDEAAERTTLRERVAVADVTARGKIDVRGSLDGALSAAGDVLTARSPTTGRSC